MSAPLKEDTPPNVVGRYSSPRLSCFDLVSCGGIKSWVIFQKLFLGIQDIVFQV